MTRVAIYARYSSDNQRDASIEDQVRVCRERVEREGWSVANVYTDHAISGASLMRPGIQILMQDASEGKFDFVIAEALDRLSRDQEDIAGFHKRMEFAGVKILCLTEGEIGSLHIGLKGTMNAMFLKDLADKTRRGLRGRVENGKSGGGLVYGYDVVKRFGEDGSPIRGEREINEFEANVVRRIFKDYCNGISPRAIAGALNSEGVKAPTGGDWGPSTIYGNRERGTGILNNELYVGRMVWNRLRYIKDPNTGKRVSRPNSEEKWVVKEVPDLRIIEDELWDEVKRLQGKYNKKDQPLCTKNRPVHLLSHLVKCGCCGGGFAMHGKKRLACSTSRNKGTCDNRLTIVREDLEHAVLSALQSHLMDEDLTAEFCKAYLDRRNELIRQHNAARNSYRRELAKLERERQKIVQSICDGVPAKMIKERAVYVDARMTELENLLNAKNDEQVVFHPQMAGRYQKEIRNLIATLSDKDNRAEAAHMLRSLIDGVVLTPSEDGTHLVVDLVGDLAGILSVATNRDKRTVKGDLSKLQPVQQNDADGPANSPENGEETASQEALVAGGCSRHKLPKQVRDPRHR